MNLSQPVSEQNTNTVDDFAGLPSPSAGAYTAAVRGLNDRFRRSFIGGQVVETPGVVDLPEAERIALLLAVRRFEGFGPDNDPHGEHDFGALELGGRRFFWRIDPYDRALLGHSPDASDPALTTRVLTVMLAEEY